MSQAFGQMIVQHDSGGGASASVGQNQLKDGGLAHLDRLGTGLGQR